ncbi:MAG: hypothetical protein H8E40_10990 [Chloroflexi bacterium]|nr:hypothetical protein [Chloroflexota bacterium]
MGHIYVLCGCSGVGKTTFINALLSVPQLNLRLIARTTGRPSRQNEREGVDYCFLPREGFLQKIFASDFAHVEEYAGDYFGIEISFVEDVINSHHDGIIMAGVYGATKLKAMFGANVSIIYLHTGTRRSLLDPRCLSPQSPEIVELSRRLLEKIEKGILVPDDPSPDGIKRYLDKRMELNFLDLAFVNGRIRSGEQITVLENIRDRMNDTLRQFDNCRKLLSGSQQFPYVKTNSCFVLMPFRPNLKPVYDDHILSVVRSLGLHCERADQIFSTKPIMEDVVDAVKNARIVRSDLTTKKPNVFYETGICHAMGKDVILITQEKDVPFDLKHIRHIHYQYTPHGMKEFEKALAATIKSVLST